MRAAESPARTPVTSRLLAYLDDRSVRISVVLVLLASLRIGATYAVFNHTIDEPAHIACGMEWLERHSYKLEPHHPPLARVVGALGPFLAGARLQSGNEMYQQSPFREGALILYAGDHYERYLLLARLGVLPFFWVTACGVYWWSKRYYGGLVATLAILLLTFLPPVLAHAGLATNDMAVTAFVGGAFAALLAWLERPSWARSIVLGATVGSAVLSKFTALVFIPVSFGAALLWYVLIRRPAPQMLVARIRVLAMPFVVAALAGALTIWAGYRFSVGISPALGMRVPAPELFNGIEGVLRLNQTGYPAYLLGQHSKSGWWYYYPVVLAVKTPLGFLLLLVVGGLIAMKRRTQLDAAYALPLIFSLTLLFLSLFSHVNTGVRYILPVYLGFSITAAIGAAEILRPASAPRWVMWGCALTLAWFMISSALSHPDYIPYTNELVGDEPEKVIADSDLDWGQDMNRAGKRLQELGVRQVAFAPFILADLRHHGWPPVTPSEPQTPAPGWNAVSITVWKVARMGLMDRYPDAPLWPDSAQPRERIGKGVLLYYFPPAPSARGGGAPGP